MVKKYYSGYMNYNFTTEYKGKKFIFDFVPLEGNGYGLLYLTDKEQMLALAASEQFEEGIVFLSETLGEKVEQEQSGEGVEDTQEFPEVTKLQEAKKILSGEPYNVAVSKFMDKAVILQKAKEVGISFPNLQ